MGGSKRKNTGLFSALFGFLAIFFQASAPAPTVDFTAQGNVFSADRTTDEQLALGHELGVAGISKPGSGSKVATVKRRRLPSGQYVGEFLDVIA